MGGESVVTAALGAVPEPGLSAVPAADCAGGVAILALAKWTRTLKVYGGGIVSLTCVWCSGLPDEEDWLKAVDTLELWLWCRDEEALNDERVLPEARRETEKGPDGKCSVRPCSRGHEAFHCCCLTSSRRWCAMDLEQPDDWAEDLLKFYVST